MADRGLTSAMATDVALSQQTIVHLMKIGFSSPDYLCSGRVNITWGSDTYLATGDILKIPDIKESFLPALDSITLTLSGVNIANVYTALSENYSNVQVSIYRANLDSSYAIVGTDPVEIFRGFIDAPSMSENPVDGTAELEWKVSSIWAAFDRVAGRRGNDADQQKWYLGDTGLEFAAKDYSNLKWGSK